MTNTIGIIFASILFLLLRYNWNGGGGGGGGGVFTVDSGRLYTWGRAIKGALGHGDNNNQLKPKLVEFFKEGTKVTSADGGSCFSVVTTGTFSLHKHK
jgi:hypothetical protein